MKLPYEICKQLKNAGFPQKIKQGDWIYTGLLGHPRLGIPYQYPPTLVFEKGAWDKLDEVIKIPTLSELIEKCEDKLTQVSRKGILWRVHGDVYKDHLYDNYSGGYEYEESEFLNIAVAKLYITLQNKNICHTK